MPLYIPNIQVNNNSSNHIVHNYLKSSMFNNSNNSKAYYSNRTGQFTSKNPAMFSYNRQYSRSISSYKYTN